MRCIKSISTDEEDLRRRLREKDEQLREKDNEIDRLMKKLALEQP